MSRVMEWMERQIAVGWLLALITIVIAAAAVLPAAHVWWVRAMQASIDAKERATPVVTMQGELVLRHGDTALVHIWGTKHRDCVYRGMQSFSVDHNGVLHDAIAVRVDTVEMMRTKPAGATYDIGVWNVQPLVEDALAVEMYVHHLCDRTDVTTMVARVALDEAPARRDQ